MRIPSLITIAALAVRGGSGGGGGSGAGFLDPEGGSQKVLLRPDMRGNIPDELDLNGVIASVREDAQSPVSCAVCETVLLQLKLAALRGDGFFVDVTTELCKRAGIEDDDVCEGAVALEGPVIAHALRGMKIGSKTSRLACIALMGLCPYPEIEPHDISFPSPKPKTRRPPPSSLKPLQVVHFSDIHVDPLENALDDFPGHKQASPHGEHACDAPISLEESMYAAINAIAPDAAFAIFTGDIVDHAIWRTSRAYNSRVIHDTYARMANAGLHVYATAGNHEVSPANAFPPTESSAEDEVSDGTSWVYELLAEVWTKWIGPRGADTTRDFGAYSVRHPSRVEDDGAGVGVGGLRVISVNTNLYYDQNYRMYEDPMEKDPSAQLEWLVRELDAAERAGERAYVVGHMPMGNRDAFRDASNYFDQIVRRYEGVIAAMFFGHTHYDEFQLSYADYGDRSHMNALVTSYIAPSMTPMSGHPAFRVYDVDPVTFAVLDATTYIANMSDPEFPSSGPKWTKYYSMKETYGPLAGKGSDLSSEQELTPAFWHNVTEALEKNETAFEEYFGRRSRRWGVGICNGECRSTEICKLRAGRAQENCVPPGLRIGSVTEMKNGRKVLEEEEECGGSVIRDTLGSIAVDENTLRDFKEVVAERGILYT
ncbi:sphingomyelin phosphodiesterase [Annulohypoxylon truncatum]|uniref:sphingomyelin phosphodiesterase n=1 Tax=Annulohypoxylon truncatum TaxID=327061 RepID=UPI0020081C1F|nr:sphingomyelin phosphodiesterase [Annulohypoxylon truncatum]KAI1205916.1 sphingomyelin phosphodiesterase [Annulohypoxylon truncatum]